MTFPSFTTGEVLTAADMNAVGLWRVTGCTVSSAGGTAATASNGVITIGTNNTSVTVNNAFSADYSRYKITVNGGAGTAVIDLQMRLGSTTTGYYGFLIYGNYNSTLVQGFGQNNTANFGYAGTGSTDTLSMNCELNDPFATKRTVITAQGAVPITTGAGSSYSGFLNDNTSYTSFTILPTTGTLTGGTIRVYGYRN